MINVTEIPTPKPVVINEPSSNLTVKQFPARSVKSRANTPRVNRKKRRKRTQPKQRSAMNEISEEEENIDDDESDEDAEIY